jgi:hypothetical protein
MKIEANSYFVTTHAGVLLAVLTMSRFTPAVVALFLEEFADIDVDCPDLFLDGRPASWHVDLDLGLAIPTWHRRTTEDATARIDDLVRRGIIDVGDLQELQNTLRVLRPETSALITSILESERV